MGMKREYQNQQKYRRWRECLDKLPLNMGQIILDLGCGTGNMSELLSEKSGKVIAVDRDEELLNLLRSKFISNIKPVKEDISDISFLREDVDGIFSGFSIAYFPSMDKTLKNWISHLKTGGFIAIIEVDDLLCGHSPLSSKTFEHLETYEEAMRRKGIYDFKSGGKVASVLQALGMKIIHNENIEDEELTASGPVSSEVYSSWKRRLDRLAINQFFDLETVDGIKKEFLDLLLSPDHVNTTKVKFVVALKEV